MRTPYTDALSAGERAALDQVLDAGHTTRGRVSLDRGHTWRPAVAVRVQHLAGAPAPAPEAAVTETVVQYSLANGTVAMRRLGDAWRGGPGAARDTQYEAAEPLATTECWAEQPRLRARVAEMLAADAAAARTASAQVEAAYGPAVLRRALEEAVATGAITSAQAAVGTAWLSEALAGQQYARDLLDDE